MSKKHGAKKHRSRKARKKVLCASCRQPASLDPPGLLASLAASLNACEEAGMKVAVAGYGALLTKQGFVLRMPGRHWAARTRSYTPFEVSPADDEMDEIDGGLDT